MVTDEPLPIGVARAIVRNELKRIYEEAGENVGRDVERAIQALMDDAVERDRSRRGVAVLID